MRVRGGGWNSPPIGFLIIELMGNIFSFYFTYPKYISWGRETPQLDSSALLQFVSCKRNLQMSTVEWRKKSKSIQTFTEFNWSRGEKVKVTISGLFEQLGFDVPAMGEELVPLVERGELRLAHDGPLLTQAQPAGVGPGVVPTWGLYLPMYLH